MRNAKGQFSTGNSGKPKGATSKVAGTRKTRIHELLESIEQDHLANDLKKLTPNQRTQLYVALLEFVVPKLNRTERELTEAEELIQMTPEERQREIIRLKNELKNAS
ncbi:MAG: hypothetical protein AAGE93_15050 [Bacteroidota bacterium]